jgi:AcrR family transcriptional regulator
MAFANTLQLGVCRPMRCANGATSWTSARAHLHPSGRPVVGISAKQSREEYLTETLVTCNECFMPELVVKSDRREELLEKIVDVLIARGVSDLALRPLAEAAGSSARLLVYHFGSKEALLGDALQRVRSRIEKALRVLAEKEEPRSAREFLLLFWRWVLLEENQGYFRLLYEVDGLVLQNRATYALEFSRVGVETWLTLLESLMGGSIKDRARSRAHATFVHASLNGLIQDFLATGDAKRTTAALHVLLEALPALSLAAPRRARRRP